MAVITLRVEDEIKSEMDSLAEDLGISTSELMRRGIEAVLLREAGPLDARSKDAPEIPKHERLTLSLLHEILYWQKSAANGRKANDDRVDVDPEIHLEAMQILEHGYSGEYDRVSGFIDDELTEAQCRFVWETLDMYRTINASLQKLKANERKILKPSDTAFPGFDLNDREEASLLRYCRFLFSTERWSEIAEQGAEHTDNFNSHTPMINRYRVMLSQWRMIQRSRRHQSRTSAYDDIFLTAVEIRQVLDAPKSLRGN